MPYLVGPDIYSRVFCARSESSARNASLIAALVVVPLSLLLATLGVLIFSLFPGIPPESALTTALAELAPVGLKGVIVVGVLGAIMSSADTTLISASTILSLNLFGPSFGLDERGRFRLTRFFVVILGLSPGDSPPFSRELSPHFSWPTRFLSGGWPFRPWGVSGETVWG